VVSVDDTQQAATGLRERLRVHVSEPLISGAYNLMATTAITGALGLGFWAVAARLFPPSLVGRDSVLINTMVAISSICQLNAWDSIVRFLPAIPAGRRAGMVRRTYALTSVVALCGAIAFVLVAPLVVRELRFVGGDASLAAAFVLATVIWGVFSVQDAVLTSMRRTSLVLAENASFSAAKIAALPLLLAVGSGHGVYLAWIAPPLLLVPVVNWVIFRHVLPVPAGEATGTAAADSGGLLGSLGIARGELMRFLAQDYAGYVLAEATLTLVPLVVLAQLGSRASAYFAIPFAITNAFDLAFYNVTTSLTVEGSRDAQRTRELTRMVVRRFLVMQIPLTAVLVIAAPVLLLPFGTDYSHQGTTALRLLGAACFLRAVTYLFAALSRLHARGTPILASQAVIAAISIGGAVELSHPLGLPGVALAWLVANAAVAIATAPGLWRYVRE